MTLEVEDGTGKTNAESFASVAEAATRLAALGITIWAEDMTEEEQEQALRRSFVHMENTYRLLWKGYRKTIEQAGSWPRTYVEVENFCIDSDIVPTEVKNANIDLALRAAAGDLNPDVGGSYPVKKKVVGPIEKDYDTSGGVLIKSYRAITMSLAPYLNLNQGRVIR